MCKARSWRACALIVTLLLPALFGCATAPSSSPPRVAPESPIPPLPLQARQPTRPEICSPTCSAGLMRLREELGHLQTKPLQPAEPAKAPMTP